VRGTERAGVDGRALGRELICLNRGTTIIFPFSCSHFAKHEKLQVAAI